MLIKCPMCSSECRHLRKMVVCTHCNYALVGPKSADLTDEFTHLFSKRSGIGKMKLDWEEFLGGMEFHYDGVFNIRYEEHSLFVGGDFHKCLLLIDIFKFILNTIYEK